MKPKLTTQQQKVLQYILRHMTEQGYPPTFREIGQAFGFRSTGTVRDHLRALVQKGYLESGGHKARGVLPKSWVRASRGLAGVIPILGRVPAGSPYLADQNIEGSVDLSRDFGGDRVFALKVRGDSMVDAGIIEGDLVVVRSQENAESGEIVVALVDGEATVKRLAKRKGTIELQPANPRYNPISVTGDTKVLGKVIGVIRSYERQY